MTYMERYGEEETTELGLRYTKLVDLVKEVLKLRHGVVEQTDGEDYSDLVDKEKIREYWRKLDELAKLVHFKTEEQGG